VAAPFRQAEFDIEFGKGISTVGCLIDYGVEQDIITKSGAFFSYRDERLGQGRGNAKAFLEDHPEVAKDIEAKIYAALGLSRDPVKSIESAGDASPRAANGDRGAGSPRGGTQAGRPRQGEPGNGSRGDWRDAPPTRNASARSGGRTAEQAA
jgi:RecA DNA recombination protein